MTKYRRVKVCGTAAITMKPWTDSKRMATRTFTGQYSSTILILIIKQLSVRQIGRLTVLLINASAYPPIGQYAAAKTDPDPKTNPNPNFSPLLHKQYVSRNPKNVLQMTPCITAENTEKSQHTDFNEDMTYESASVACSYVRLWKVLFARRSCSKYAFWSFHPLNDVLWRFNVLYKFYLWEIAFLLVRLSCLFPSSHVDVAGGITFSGCPSVYTCVTGGCIGFGRFLVKSLYMWQWRNFVPYLRQLVFAAIL